MFKSFSDSIRSLWQSKPTVTVPTSREKRKRPSDDPDPDDSDVEIVMVKKPKHGNINSSSGLFSFLTIPIGKMSDWVRKKTAGQEHIFIQPVLRRAPQTRGAGEGQRRMPNRHNVHTSATMNGSLPYRVQSDNELSRPPLHSHNGACENGVSEDVHIVGVHPGACPPPSSSSSRRSSCSSSSVRQGPGRRSTVQQCFQLKEKEDYRKLLQQYTSITLGCDTAHSSSSHHCHTHRVGKRNPNLVSGKDSVGLSGPRGRVQQSHNPFPTHAQSRTHQGRSYRDTAGRQQVKTRSPSTDSDPDVIIVDDDDMNGSASEHSPSLTFLSSQYLDDNWINRLHKKYALAERQRQQLIEETEMKKKLLEDKREERLGSLDKRLRQQMSLFDGGVEVIDERPRPEEEQETSLPELTDFMQREINAALGDGPPHQVLSTGFRLQLSRADFATLKGLNWLNDEVINFYMNMLMERGEQIGFRKTYAVNTFFYPKLMGEGHSGLKRWTRKVDIFSHHYLVIPVHLGVHWCLCVVFMEEKAIRYYDSMGGNNIQCLNAVRQYLYDESVQKRSVKLDLSEWSAEIVTNIPQQMNGSDCGMFSCMYAESLTRGAQIAFTQRDMPYFRRRMVYELLTKQLL